jgi:hypothetical protein
MATPRTLANALANRVQARKNCENKHALGNSTGNHHWYAEHARQADRLAKEHLPSGSGFDSGTRIDWDKSTGEKLVFITSFHHMDEFGGYDGWTDHVVTVRPSLVYGLSLTIGGRNRNDIKELIHQAFDAALSAMGEF